MPSPQRVYLPTPQPIAAGQMLALAAGQVHYLVHVLRLGEGSEVRVFNQASGEWRACLKRHAKTWRVAAMECVRPPRVLPSLTLAFAPVKRGALASIIRQASELGVTRFVPVITEFTEVRRVNTARLMGIASEAAEQCGRLCLPRIDLPIMLAEFLAGMDTNRRSLLFCDEMGHGRGTPSMAEYLASTKPLPSVVLLGPEGGFSPKEREILLAHQGVVAVCLGEAILRADTAAVVALGAWQMANR